MVQVWVPIAVTVAALSAIAAIVLYIYTSKRRQFVTLVTDQLSALADQSLDAYKHATQTSSPAQKDDDDDKLDVISEGEGEETVSEEANVQSVDDLPPCVAAFLQHAIRDSRTFRLFTIGQKLELRFTKNGPWVEVPGCVQRASPLVPAFVFHGTATMGLGRWVEGFESLIGGVGRMNWNMWGAFNVARNEGGELINRAAHVRWLSEAIAFPQALQPSKHLRWEAVPDHPNQATAVLTLGSQKGSAASSSSSSIVTATYTFNDRHNIVKFYSPDYCRSMPNGSVAACGLSGKCRTPMVLGLTPQISALVGMPVDQHGTTGGIVVPVEMEGAFVDLKTGEEEVYVKVLIRKVEVAV